MDGTLNMMNPIKFNRLSNKQGGTTPAKSKNLRKLSKIKNVERLSTNYNNYEPT